MELRPDELPNVPEPFADFGDSNFKWWDQATDCAGKSRRSVQTDRAYVEVNGRRSFGAVYAQEVSDWSDARGECGVGSHVAAGERCSKFVEELSCRILLCCLRDAQTGCLNPNRSITWEQIHDLVDQMIEHVMQQFSRQGVHPVAFVPQKSGAEGSRQVVTEETLHVQDVSEIAFRDEPAQT